MLITELHRRVGLVPKTARSVSLAVGPGDLLLSRSLGGGAGHGIGPDEVLAPALATTLSAAAAAEAAARASCRSVLSSRRRCLMVSSKDTSRSGSEVVSDAEGSRGLDLGGSAEEVASDSLRGRTLGVSPGASAGAIATVPVDQPTPPSASLPEGGLDDSGGGSNGSAAGSGFSGTASGGSHG